MKEINILFDSKIIVDVFTQRDGFQESTDCFLRMAANEFNGFIVSKQMTDIYYVLRKYFDKPQRNEIIGKLLQLFNVLSLDDNDLKNALLLDGNDYEDNVLIAVALKEKVDYILTNDKKDFEKSEIEAVTPKELIKLLEKEKD